MVYIDYAYSLVFLMLLLAASFIACQSNMESIKIW